MNAINTTTTTMPTNNMPTTTVATTTPTIPTIPMTTPTNNTPTTSTAAAIGGKVLIVLSIIQIVAFHIYEMKKLSPQIDQYNQQKQNYNKQVSELIQTFNDTVEEKGLSLQKIDLEEFQYIQEFVGEETYNLFQQIQAFKQDYSTNNIILSQQNYYLNMFYKIISTINGCQNFVFVGQVIPILTTVFEQVYQDEYKSNGNYIDINGARYIRLDGIASVNDTQLQPQWQIYFGTDYHVPNFNNKQIVGNQLKNTSDQNFYNASFNYYLDQSVEINGVKVQKPVLSKPENDLNNPKVNQYTIDFNNKALPRHEHKIYEFTQEKRTVFDVKKKTGTKYIQFQPEDNVKNMDIHNTESLKKAKSTKPENHPATINVSDPCIDVCYLLCVDIKTPF